MIDPTQPGKLIHSPSLAEYAERKASGLIPPFMSNEGEEWSDSWTLAVSSAKARELKNQYSRVGILIEHNFTDFLPVAGAEEVFEGASIEDIARAKARAVYHATGLPSMAEASDMTIDAPESGSKITKSLQHGYWTKDIYEDGDAMIDKVRPISDENRCTRFSSCVAYFDGEVEIITQGKAVVAIVFANTRYCSIAVAAAFDDMFKDLTRRVGLSYYNPDEFDALTSMDGSTKAGRIKLAGATMLRERLMREAQLLGDGILKVSSFLNHMVDVELMEECGLELAERLRSTMPSKILTVESTGLIPAIPVARQLGIPLIFARKSKPITISDSYQTTYRSATKGTTNEIVVSCEYLHAGDRVLIIDDFLAGGSTAEALFKLANMAHAKVVGVGVLIEKMASGGRAFLSGYNVPVESLAKVSVSDAHNGDLRLDIQEEKPWTVPNSKAASSGSSNGTAIESNTANSNSSNSINVNDVEILNHEDDVGVLNGTDDDDLFDDIEDILVRNRRN